MSQKRSAIVLLLSIALVVAVASSVAVVRVWSHRVDGDRTTSAPSGLGAGETASTSSTSNDGPGALAARPSTTGPSVVPAGDLPPSINFAKIDRDLDLHGTVVGAAGAPIAGADLATVMYPFRRASLLAHDRYDEAVEGPRTKSASDGTFAIRLRRGVTVGLRVAAVGFASVERPTCHAGERVKIALSPGVALVVEATTPVGGPAAGAAFRLWSSGSDRCTIERNGTTGADGRVRFDELPAGTSAWLESGPSPWGDIEWKDVTLPESGQATVAVSLQPGRTITGRVTDADTKAPVAGARVGMNWTLHRAVTTDADGLYALPGWTGVGIQDVHVLASGYGRGQSLVGSATVLDFALSKGDTVTGRVVGRDGAPVAGAIVAAVGSVQRDGEQVTSSAEGTSGADGHFSLAGLRRDMPHTLVVMPVGFGRTLIDFDPRSDGAGTIDLGNVAVSAARTLSGRVLEHDGAPTADVGVTVTGANADRGQRRVGEAPIEMGWYGNHEDGRTDDLGRFRFPDLAPGTYEVEVKPTGIPAQRATVRVPDDADPAPIEISLPAGRPVRIVVVDENGKPVPWAYVSVVDAAGRDTNAHPLDASATTTLLLADTVTAIDVTIFGSGGDDRRFVGNHNSEFQVEPKATEVRCVLHTGVPLRGRVVGPDGTAVVSAALVVESAGEVVASDTTIADGRFEVTVPRSGRFTVRLVGALWTMRAPAADLGLAGEVSDVVPGAQDVVLKAHATVRSGRQSVAVVDPDGKPVAGLRVFATWAWGAGKSAEATTDTSGHADLDGLPDLACSWETAAPPPDTDLLAGRDSTSVPAGRIVEIRLRRGVRVRGRVVVPSEAAGLPVSVEVDQGTSRRQTVPIASGQPAFSVLLDPRYGTTGSVSARVGPADAARFTARISPVRFGDGEIVLTLEPVK